jgi:hypothetical protein
VAMVEGGRSLQMAAAPDAGKLNEQNQNKFETSLEDFHSVVDQMELNIRCAMETINQCQSSQKYMPITLSYPQVS